MQNSKILKKNADIVNRVIEDETILMPIYKTSDEINCIYTLNKSAAFVWDAIDGKRSIAEIKKMVAEKFDTTPGEIDKEMTALFNDLKEIKAVS